MLVPSGSGGQRRGLRRGKRSRLHGVLALRGQAKPTPLLLAARKEE